MIEEASRGSKFYAKKQADQAKISQQAKEMAASLASFTSLELDSARADADLLIRRLRTGRILNKVSNFSQLLRAQWLLKGDSACGHGHVLCSSGDEGPA